MLASGGGVAQLVTGKAARDALFLSTFDVRRLPYVVAGAAFASLGSAVVTSRAMAIWSPGRVVPAALALSSLLYAVERTLLGQAPELVAIALYVHVAMFGSALIAGFWSLVNESFDPHTAKRSVRGIAMGGTAGGALGGLAAYELGGSSGLPATLTLLCLLNLACIPAVMVVARAGMRTAAPADPEKPKARSFALFSEARYLRQLAGVVALAAVISTLLDYVMSARVVAFTSNAKELVAFFALFHMGVGLSSFALQALCTRISLERLGLAGTIALLPGSVVVAGIAAIAVPGLGTAVALRGTESLFASSLYRAGYELLYTPLPRSLKRPAKMLIDVGIDRVGTAVGSGIVMLSLRFAGATAEQLLIGLAVVAAGVSLSVAGRLHRGYVESLASSLKRGVVRLRDTDIFDDTTRRTLAETTALNRQTLLEAIERQRGQHPESLFPPDGVPSAPSEPPDEGNVVFEAHHAGFGAAPMSLRFAPPSSETPNDPVLEALADLGSGDVERARRRLTAREPLPLEAVPRAIDLLGKDELSRPALRALRTIAPRITGQLVDALLDPERRVVVRRRIPRVLEVSANRRAVNGLLEGLFDAEFDVRHQCAWALQRITDQDPSFTITREKVFEAVREEIDRGRSAWNEGHTGARSRDEAKARILRTVEHGVVVLSLALEREPLQLAYRALLSGDETLRGTALEYFANVLPEDLRESAMPFLEGLTPRKTALRQQSELREELLKTRGS